MDQNIPLYPDHRAVPANLGAGARARIAVIDEQFAQMREQLNPLVDRYCELVVERERLMRYTVPDISTDERDVMRIRAIEMLRVDPEGYLAPVVRMLLALTDSLEHHGTDTRCA